MGTNITLKHQKNNNSKNRESNSSNKFDYDVTVLDVIRDPEIILKKVEAADIFCDKCHFPFKWKFRDAYILGQCGCLTLLFYPPRKDRRSHLLNFKISKEYLTELQRITKNNSEKEFRQFVSDEHAKKSNHK